eukprot:16716_1
MSALKLLPAKTVRKNNENKTFQKCYNLYTDNNWYHCHPNLLKLSHKESNIITIPENISKQCAIKILNNKKKVEMLHHCGCYDEIMSLVNTAKRFKHGYICAIGATEQYQKLYELKLSPSKSEISKIPLIIVDTMDENMKILHSNLILEQFIDLYIQIEMLSVIKSRYVFNKQCSEYRNDRTCDHCKFTDNENEAYLGYLMLFCTDIIFNKLQSISETKLIKMLMFYYKQRTVNYRMSNDVQLRYKCKILKRWTRGCISSYGIDHIMFAWEYYSKLYPYNKNGITCESQTKIFHIVGQMYHLIKNCEANVFLTMSACIAKDLYER